MQNPVHVPTISWRFDTLHTFELHQECQIHTLGRKKTRFTVTDKLRASSDLWSIVPTLQTMITEIRPCVGTQWTTICWLPLPENILGHARPAPSRVHLRKEQKDFFIRELHDMAKVSKSQNNWNRPLTKNILDLTLQCKGLRTSSIQSTKTAQCVRSLSSPCGIYTTCCTASAVEVHGFVILSLAKAFKVFSRQSLLQWWVNRAVVMISDFHLCHLL